MYCKPALPVLESQSFVILFHFDRIRAENVKLKLKPSRFII